MSEETTAALRALVYGRVQGVGYRAFAVQQARALDLRGFARNLSDGRTVEVVAEGPRRELQDLLTVLRQGPPGSYVQRVDASWGEATGSYTAFDVR